MPFSAAQYLNVARQPLCCRKFTVISKSLSIIVCKVHSYRTQRLFCLANKSLFSFFFFFLLFIFRVFPPNLTSLWKLERTQKHTRKRGIPSYLQSASDVMIMIIINTDFSQYGIFDHNWVLHELALIHINTVNVPQESCMMLQTFHARCVCNMVPPLKNVRYTMIRKTFLLQKSYFACVNEHMSFLLYYSFNDCSE